MQALPAAVEARLEFKYLDDILDLNWRFRYSTSFNIKKNLAVFKTTRFFYVDLLNYFVSTNLDLVVLPEADDLRRAIPNGLSFANSINIGAATKMEE